MHRRTLAVLGLLPAMIALPTVDLASVAGLRAAAGPVSGSVREIAISGVDAGGLRGLATGPQAGRVTALTPPRTTARFDLVALTWSGTLRADTTLSVRVRENGQWTAWHTLESDEHAPNPGQEVPPAGAKGASSPLLTAGADGVQVRVVSPTGSGPSGLHAVMVDGGRSAADSPSGPAASAAAATRAPTIISRAKWGADESLVKDPPIYDTTARTLFIHHTDTTNTYTAAQAYAQVRSVYLFHTKSRGWNDVGYNFLVDRFGRVFEGRRGSITQAVRGAHTGGFNTEAIGISVLGTFTTVSPSSAALRGVVDVAAWKSAQYFVNPRGSVYVTSSGGASKFPAGKRVLLRTISGHRDVGSTECPGDKLYPDLNWMRGAVAARMAPGLIGPRLSSTAVAWNGSPVGFSAVVPTNQKWSFTVRPMCASTPINSQTGMTASRIGAIWDLKDTNGAPAAPGVYQVSVVSNSPVGSVRQAQDLEILPTVDSPAGRCRVARAGVVDVYTSAVLAGRSRYPSASSVVLAGSGSLVDGLVAAPLAAAKGAPLLPSGLKSLPAVVAQDITARGGVTTAYIVGGTTSISAAVETQLRGLGVTAIVRLSGRDRYAMSAAVARQMGAAGGAAVVVSGSNVADAAAVAGPAAATGRPLLLVASTGVPAATGSALKALGVKRVLVVGTTAAVPAKVAARLSAYGVTRLSRVGSADRASTATAVATAFANPVGINQIVAVPSSTSLWSVVGAGQGRLTVLASSSTVPPATAAWLRARHPGAISLMADQRTVNTAVMRSLLVNMA